MKFKIGVVLIIIQVLAVFGTVSSGGFAAMGVIEKIGYFLPAIIGVVLIYLDVKE
ncbi:MAG: hypothetical protein IJN68_00180 [Clostridia bacterium]|nr:hypothetical protein [Clostridia bacterium]